MRPFHTFAPRHYITLTLCAIPLIALLGAGLSPASGSRSNPVNVDGQDGVRAQRAMASQNKVGTPLLGISPGTAKPNLQRDVFRLLRPASMPTPFVAALTATKTDNLSTPVNPGDTIMYTVEITNTGDMDATNVNFTDTIDVNTTLVPGSVVVAPIAVNDSYNTIGNVNITIPVGQGVILNDLNPNGSGTLSVTQVNATAVPPAGNATVTTVGGSVTMSSDGSFTYTPDPGFRGPNYTFTYTLSNSATPGKTDTATVTIAINGLIWFIDDSASPAGANGTLAKPFTCIVGAGCFDPVATDIAGDSIFLFSGNYSDAAALTLLNNQILIGQGAPDSILTITGLPAPSGTNLLPATNGTDPVITTTLNATAIILGQGNQLHGFTVGNTGATGTDISGTNFGNLTVKDLTLNGTGQALDLATGTFVAGATFVTVESSGGSPAEGVQLNAVGGSFTVTTTNIVNPTGTGIDVQNSPTGTSFSFGATTVDKGTSGGGGVNLNANVGIFAFSSLAVTTSNGTGVAATSSGTVNVTTGSINATGGPALLVNPTTIGMTFTSVSSSTSTTTGVSLTSVTGSLTIATTTVTNAAGIGILVEGLTSGSTTSFGTTNVTNPDANTTGGTGVLLVNNVGTVSFSVLNITPETNQRGLIGTGNTGLITTTSGTIATVNNTAVEIAGPSAASRTPLNMTLTSVSATGTPPNGILLLNTNGPGGNVGFVLNGGSSTAVGGDGSGGTISNATGADGAAAGSGIRLENADEVTIRRVTINGTNQNFAIRGIAVTAFTLEFSTIAGTNGNNGAFEEGSVSFDNLTGSAAITSCNISGAWEDNVRVLNTGGTLNRLTVTNTTIGLNSLNDGNNGIGVEATGASTTLNATITGCTFTGTRADWVNATTQTNSTMDIDVLSSTFSNNHANSGSAGVRIIVASNGNTTYNITGNTLRDSKGSAIFANAANSAAVLSGRIEGNTVGLVAVANSGSSEASAIALESNGGGDHTSLVLNNTLRQYNNQGINMTIGTTLGNPTNINFTIQGNLLTNPGTINNDFNAIHLNNGTAPGENFTSCIDIGGAGALANDVDQGADGATANLPNTADIRVRQRQSTTVRLPGYGGANNDNAAVQTYLRGRNITRADPDGAQASNTVPTGGGFIGGAACTQPPMSMQLEQPEVLSKLLDAVKEEPVYMDILFAPEANSTSGGAVGVRQTDLLIASQAAIARWRKLGASEEDLERLRAVQFEIADLPDDQLVITTPTRIIIDETAAGFEWFVDGTPDENEEFDKNAANQLKATEKSYAFGRIDLLTAVTRSLDYVLEHSWWSRSINRIGLMQPILPPSTRRVPEGTVHRPMPLPEPVIETDHVKVSSANPASTPVVSATESAPSGIVINRPAGGSARRESPFAGLRTAVFDLTSPEYSLLKVASNASGGVAGSMPAAVASVATAAAPFSGETVTKSLGTIPPGEKAVIMFSVTVDNPVTPNTIQVCNQGSVTSTEVPGPTLTDDPDVVGANNPTCTPLNVADLNITKTDSPDPVTAGNNITYTVTVTNGGPAVANNVTMSDAIPANTTFVSTTTPAGWTRNDSTAVGATGTLMFSKPTMANAESAVFTIVVKVNSNVAAGVLITNTATTATTSPDPTANNTATAQTTVATSADLMVTKTDSPDPVNAGANITYTITLTNNGPSDAQTVTLQDATPANTTFVSVTTPAGWTRTDAVPAGGTGTIAFSKATVAAAESATFTLVLNVNANTPHNTIITNNAVGASTTTDPTPANNTGIATTTVIAIADLAVTKSDSPDPVFAGANITYTINFVNNGPAAAGSVTVTDAVPVNTTFVSAAVTTGTGWTTMAPAVGATGNVVFSKATVANGETAVFTIVVKVNSNTASGATITNSVTAASTNTDPDPSNNTATAMTTVATQADLAVTKSDSPDPVSAGANLTYTINFVNNGPSDAQTVTVTDAVPANTTFVSAAVTTGTGWSTSNPAVGGTGNVVFSKATVAAGETAVFTIVVNVNANTADGATITNSAVAATVTTDPTPGNNTGTATTTVQTRADLAVTKADSPDPVTAGNNLTYTISFVNNGPSDAQLVTVTDAVPANTTFVSATVTTGSGWSVSAPAVGGTGNVVFSKGTVLPGETATFTMVVNVNSNTAAGTIITNSAVGASTTVDPTPGNNTGTSTTTVNASADLAVTKTDTPDPVFAGDNITYTINFANNGPSAAQSVTVTDAVPANATFVSAVVTTGTGWTVMTPAVGGTGNVVFSKMTVAAGETAVFTLVVNVNSNTTGGTTITNSATAASTTTDPTPGNNTGTATTTVQAQADLAVTKSDSPDPVIAGNNLTYTINFVNNGPSDAMMVTVTDVVPANTTFVSATVTTGAGWITMAPAVGGTGTVTFSKVMVVDGETAVFTIVVNVNASTPNGTIISNTATTTGATSDPTPANNSDTETTTVQTQADLAVTKSDSPDPVIAGTNLTYTVNFTNNGPSDAQTVTVTDAVPANATFVSASVTTGSGWSITSPAVGGTGNVVFSKATVAAGETAVFSIVVNINSNTANGATITNSAIAASPTTDPTPGNNTGTSTTTVQTSADIAVTKSDSPDPVFAGNNLTYTINFVNNGPSDAQMVTVTDAVPANTTFVSATVTTGTGWTVMSPAVGGTGNVVFSKSPVAAGETAVFTMVVNVNGGTADGATITNSAVGATTTTDPTPGNNTGTTTTTVVMQADLAVTKSDSPDPVVASQNLTYTISFVNNGPSSANSVTVTDAVPANSTFVSATVTTGSGWSVSSPAVGGTGNVVFSKSPVIGGETAVFTMVVNVNAGTPNGTIITNSATAASTTTDGTPGNNTGTTTTTVVSLADLAVTKSDSPDPACSGQNLTYTINYSNAGPGPGLNTTVTDAVPANTTFVSASVTVGSGWSITSPPVGGTGNVVFSKASSANGDTAVFTIVVMVNLGTPGGTIITNSVTAASSITDPNPGNNTATTMTTVDPTAPVITCPANVTAVPPTVGMPCAVVNFPAPVVTDNCPGATVVCSPASGSCFPIGTTTVTCTATDTSGNTATCSFSVTTFDLCVQDDSVPGKVVLVNTTTGQYRFCCGGNVYTGTGSVTVKGNLVTVQDNAGSRRVLIKVDRGTKIGTASLQTPPGVMICSIRDTDISNNSCVCQ